MIHRLTVEVPRPPEGAQRALARGSAAVVPPRPLRILAVSDEAQPELWGEIDRDHFGPLDLFVSAGDLPPGYLSYLEGTLRVPFAYAIGNHDLDSAWRDHASRLLPARSRGANLVRLAGVDVIVLDWPSTGKVRTRAQDRSAWGEAIGLRITTLLERRAPLIVVSHVAPNDGVDPRDIYHRGFRAYRWLAEQLRPALWIHGHTTPASMLERVTQIGPTTAVNVSGAYVIELRPAGEPATVPEPSPDTATPAAPLSPDPRADPRPAAHSGSPRG